MNIDGHLGTWGGDQIGKHEEDAQHPSGHGEDKQVYDLLGEIQYEKHFDANDCTRGAQQSGVWRSDHRILEQPSDSAKHGRKQINPKELPFSVAILDGSSQEIKSQHVEYDVPDSTVGGSIVNESVRERVPPKPWLCRIGTDEHQCVVDNSLVIRLEIAQQDVGDIDRNIEQKQIANCRSAVPVGLQSNGVVSVVIAFVESQTFNLPENAKNGNLDQLGDSGFSSTGG